MEKSPFRGAHGVQGYMAHRLIPWRPAMTAVLMQPVGREHLQHKLFLETFTGGAAAARHRSCDARRSGLTGTPRSQSRFGSKPDILAQGRRPAIFCEGAAR